MINFSYMLTYLRVIFALPISCLTSALSIPILQELSVFRKCLYDTSPVLIEIGSQWSVLTIEAIGLGSFLMMRSLW